jgi:hypothetical protein
VAFWTGHTVAAPAGALGAEYRRYEIDPSTATLFQSRKAQSPSLYVFMGAISPDHNGKTANFGSNAMALSTSSGTDYTAAAMTSVVGGTQSGIVTIFKSPASDTDFTCTWPY